jgi:hypothetical protein
MSRYRIYQVDHFDPQIVGRKKRRLFAMYSFNMLEAFNGSFIILLIIVLPISTTLYFILLNKLKNESFKTIGDIEFTTNHIRKRIGDSFSEYDFHSIKGLELERHIPSITAKNSKSGYFSYILKIVFNNSETESLVVSDKPIDSNQNLSIVDTMKTLKKFIRTDIKIIT